MTALTQKDYTPNALIFDHEVAKKLWGADWQKNLSLLALEPVETRDKLLATLYAARKQQPRTPSVTSVW